MSVDPLPEPAIERCFFDEGFQPHLPAMALAWPGMPAVTGRLWLMPDGSVVPGNPPSRFGIDIHRHAADRYAVRLLWNHTRLSWGSLTRRQLEASCLDMLLRAMGTDFRYLLDQPVEMDTVPSPLKVA